MKVKQIIESTTAGSVATVAAPLGKTKKRGGLFTGKTTNKPFYEGDGTAVAGLQPAEKVMKGKAKKKGPYANSIVEGKIKEISTDMDQLSDKEFKKKYGKTKQEMRAALKEEKISEQDLIVVPGMRRSKDKSFISHKEDRRDHEVEMARSDLYATAKNAMRIFHLLKDRTEDEGLMGWQQSYITLAADYLNSVADSIEYNAKVKGELDEMTGGVIAGGMSNFEEAQEPAKLNAPKNPVAKGHQKTSSGSGAHKDKTKVIPRKEKYKDHDLDEAKCPHCGGEMVSEEQMNEKKDACYYKVKSRYKVWPSAYASGALVKCRKKGSKNWGKSKK